jgi:two-component system cell cycle sensor histidine kinase/response regulator CckA
MDSRGSAILVVDDELMVCNVVKSLLTKQGYSVVVAGGGIEALGLFQQRGPDFGLLLTDILMPGLSGPELAKQVLALKPALPVIFMSGTPGAIAADPIVRNCPVLIKPFTSNQLIAAVAAAIENTN